MSTRRISREAGFVNPSQLPKGPNGRALCRQCGVEVPRGRRTFCGDPCVDAWSVKTNPTRMREVVFRRDQGVCAVCGLDTKQLTEEFWALARSHGIKRHEWWKIDYTPEVRQWFRDHGIPRHRRDFWDADHIVPVVEGGGECSVDNIRTLCIPCHKAATAELARRRSAQRAAEHAAGKPKPRTMRWPG